MNKAYAQTKNITIDTNPSGTTSVMDKQSAGPGDEGLNVGGVSLNTDLQWYGDAFIVLLLVALIYVGKKTIDKWFDKRSLLIILKSNSQGVSKCELRKILS